MIRVELKNVSVSRGERFRPKQNYSLILWETAHGIDANTTEEDIRCLIEKYFHRSVSLNNRSTIKIVENTAKK